MGKVVTEVYKSSLLTELEKFGAPNQELANFATLVLYEPHWCGGMGMPEKVEEFRHLECKHIAVFPTYFLNYKLAPPRLSAPLQDRDMEAEAGSAVKACLTPSSTCTDGQIREWIERNILLGGAQKWVQQSGKSTFNTSDDTFELSPGLDQSAEGVKRHAMSFATVRAQSAEEPWWQHRVKELVVPTLFLLGCGTVLGVGVRVGCGFARRKVSEELSGSSDEENVGSVIAKQPMVRDLRTGRASTSHGSSLLFTGIPTMDSEEGI